MRRLKTVRRPPIYPKTPGHLPCSSLTHPLPLSSRRPSVSFGGFGLNTNTRLLVAAWGRGESDLTAPRCVGWPGIIQEEAFPIPPAGDLYEVSLWAENEGDEFPTILWFEMCYYNDDDVMVGGSSWLAWVPQGGPHLIRRSIDIGSRAAGSARPSATHARLMVAVYWDYFFQRGYCEGTRIGAYLDNIVLRAVDEPLPILAPAITAIRAPECLAPTPTPTPTPASVP